jgi:hypothetical protein
MGILGRPQGLFELHSSDSCVGSMLSKSDVVEILGVTESDLQSVPFKNWNGIEAIDERDLQKLWYASAIPNSPPSKIGNASVSLDEMILVKLVEIAYPNATIEHQVPWGRRRVDLKISVDGVSKLVEFHGPSHSHHLATTQALSIPQYARRKSKNTLAWSASSGRTGFNAAYQMFTPYLITT